MPALRFTHLDDITRKLMIAEVDTDLSANTLYISKRLTSQGRNAYPNLLYEAVEKRNDVWLANSLVSYMTVAEGRGDGLVRTPITAATTLAQGEFNHFYMRAICCRALSDNLGDVIVCRIKPVQTTRLTSSLVEGTSLNPESLLAELRQRHRETMTTLLGQPNSGLSVRLP